MGCSASKVNEPTGGTLPAAPVVRPTPTPAPAPVPQPVKAVEPKPVAVPTPAPDPQPVKPVEAEKPKPVAVKDDDNEAFGLLLCGAGESGKTTFTRQLKLKFLDGFKNEERIDFLRTIRGNLIETMQLLLIWLEHHNIEIEDDDARSAAEEIAEVDPFEAAFTDDIAEKLQQLWEDPTIKQAFQHKDETPIPDHIPYFYSKIDQLVSEDYIPTDEDVLRARIRTIGIEAVTFNLEGALIRIFDVGGQKNERSKWSKVMDQVEGVIFCISFAEFDKPMFEDPSILRSSDALDIFESITHQEKFKASPVFLVCNKYDVFEEKVRNTDAFRKVFPDFTGDYHDPEACAAFFINKFLERAAPLSDERPIVQYKIVALRSNDVVNTANAICKFISEKYFE